MTARVFIPIPRSPMVDLRTGDATPEWYLFFSRKLSSTTSLLDSADFGVDANILANRAFNQHAPVQPLQDNGILVQQIFGG